MPRQRAHELGRELLEECRRLGCHESLAEVLQVHTMILGRVLREVPEAAWRTARECASLALLKLEGEGEGEGGA